MHQWRSEEQGILVGSGTVMNDNPLLTVREVHGKNPLRIVIDLNNRIPLDSDVLIDGQETLVYNSTKSSKQGALEYKTVEMSDNAIHVILADLHHRGVQSIFVEGGAITLNSFLDTIWDEARVFVSADNLSDGLKAPEMDKDPENITKIGKDELHIYRRDQ